MEQQILTRSQVLARLRRGDRCRTGYTFTRSALFDDGAEAPGKVMRRLYREGLLLQDRDGFVTIDKEADK